VWIGCGSGEGGVWGSLSGGGLVWRIVVVAVAVAGCWACVEREEGEGECAVFILGVADIVSCKGVLLRRPRGSSSGRGQQEQEVALRQVGSSRPESLLSASSPAAESPSAWTTARQPPSRPGRAGVGGGGGGGGGDVSVINPTAAVVARSAVGEVEFHSLSRT
jgi:hypothetical protein